MSDLPVYGPEGMIARAEQLEAQARALREEGIVKGPEGAEDLEETAQDWRRTAEASERVLDRDGMELAHAQGLHDDLPRDGCPTCDDRKGRC